MKRGLLPTQLSVSFQFLVKVHIDATVACSYDVSCSVIRCVHEAIVAAIGRATDRRDDRLV